MWTQQQLLFYCPCCLLFDEGSVFLILSPLKGSVVLQCHLLGPVNVLFRCGAGCHGDERMLSKWAFLCYGISDILGELCTRVPVQFKFTCKVAPGLNTFIMKFAFAKVQIKIEIQHCCTMLWANSQKTLLSFQWFQLVQVWIGRANPVCVSACVCGLCIWCVWVCVCMCLTGSFLLFFIFFVRNFAVFLWFAWSCQHLHLFFWCSFLVVRFWISLLSTEGGTNTNCALTALEYHFCVVVLAWWTGADPLEGASKPTPFGVDHKDGILWSPGYNVKGLLSRICILMKMELKSFVPSLFEVITSGTMCPVHHGVMSCVNFLWRLHWIRT